MFSPLRKQVFFVRFLNGAVWDMPVSMNLSYWWNFGSLLGVCLILQIITGIFLSMHYTAHVDMAFDSVVHIMRDVNWGWLLRSAHANGASAFFLCLYLHIGRGLYYGGYYKQEVWNLGVIMFVLVMGSAFMGYVLPWGQMSYWGATVITNLLSAIPYIGKDLVEWVWGGFCVNNATLNRFYTFHFLLPFVILLFTLWHIVLLHETGSGNPLGVDDPGSMVPFHPYYTAKDLLGIVVMMFGLMVLCLFLPKMFSEPANYIPANSMVTPLHIKPEWYFLWAYAILRSIPNKLGGVVAMFGGILILFVVPLLHAWQLSESFAFYFPNQIIFWALVGDMCLLTWIGARPVEYPYDVLGAAFTEFYFFYFIYSAALAYDWDSWSGKETVSVV